MLVVVFTANFTLAAPQDAWQADEPESLADKYKKYKTTLKSRAAGIFGEAEEGLVDYSNRAQKQNNSGVVNYDRDSNALDFSAGVNDFQSQFNDLFKQEDFTQDDLQNVTRQFQVQYQQMLTQPDALYKELSAKPYRNQGGYTNPASYSSRRDSGLNATNADQPRSNNTSGSAYEAEQPALIAWIFSVIRYVREHPLVSGLIALTVLGLLSLLQVVIRRFARPYG